MAQTTIDLSFSSEVFQISGKTKLRLNQVLKLVMGVTGISDDGLASRKS